jgi:hypothetical protein
MKTHCEVVGIKMELLVSSPNKKIKLGGSEGRDLVTCA